VGGQAEAGNPNPAGSHDAQAPATPPTPDEFRAYVTAIDKTLNALEEAEQTAIQLLETESGAPLATTQAAQLYTMARLCRNFVATHTPELKTAGWLNEAAFLKTFKKLYDTWSTYHRVLEYRRDMNWDEGPTPGQVLADLEVPRRKFVDALDAYRQQLGVVKGFLTNAGPDAQS
jgi:hypothetical protein